MADQKVSAMSAATLPLTGAELVPVIQGGANKKVPLSALNGYSLVDLFSRYPLIVPIRGFLNNYAEFPSGQPPCTVWLDGQTVNLQGTINHTSGTPASNDRMFNLPTGFEALDNQNSFNPSAVVDNTFNFQPGFVATDSSVAPKKAFIIYALSVGTTFQFLFCTANFRSGGYLSGGLFKAFTGPSDRAVVLFPGPLPVNSAGLKVCFYFHGLGDDVFSHISSPDGVTGTQNLFRSTLLALLADGWVVISSDGGPTVDSWGNPNSFLATTAALNWLKSIANVSKITALGQSAGGITSLRALCYFPGIVNWYGIYPCTNLQWLYQNQPSFVASMNAAYSVSNYAGFQAATTATDPMLFTLSTFAAKKLRMTASYADTVVDRVNNSDALTTRVSGTAASVTELTSTGNHGDPSNFVPSDVITFLNS